MERGRHVDGAGGIGERPEGGVRKEKILPEAAHASLDGEILQLCVPAIIGDSARELAQDEPPFLPEGRLLDGCLTAGAVEGDSAGPQCEVFHMEMGGIQALLRRSVLVVEGQTVMEKDQPVTFHGPWRARRLPCDALWGLRPCPSRTDEADTCAGKDTR